ncbi:girdin isoform X2 [Drosophila ficusphila]|uniref:girdin isoform X2 n=1 Tax=Drosophila ficusphila TaxID=30025 RepID=UPI0007E5F36B|nr:girdin isoform X2 [Drosophila ficusphila]
MMILPLKSNCNCNDLETKIDTKMLELENKLKRSEIDLLLANEKIAMFDEKIKDKNDIIEALILSNNLYRFENKEKIDNQASKIKTMEEQLCKIKQEKIKLGQENKKLMKQPNESASLIASLRAQINEMGAKKNKDLVSLRAQIKENCKKETQQKVLIVSLKNQIKENCEKEREQKILIASLRTKINEIGAKKNKDLASLNAEIKEKDKIITENKALIQHLENQIRGKDDQTTLLELGAGLETLRMKEKDDLLEEQAATILKLKSYQEKQEENEQLISSLRANINEIYNQFIP